MGELESFWRRELRKMRGRGPFQRAGERKSGSRRESSGEHGHSDLRRKEALGSVEMNFWGGSNFWDLNHNIQIE